MRNVTEVHQALIDANNLFDYLSKEEIIFSNKKVKDKMLVTLAERINILSWVLNI